MTGYASRGPIGKRSDDRIRRAPGVVESKKVFIDQLVSNEVQVPIADENWHPMAISWFEGACQSAQTVYYEQSDWETLRLIAEAMSRELEDQVLAVIPATVSPDGAILEERKVIWGKAPIKGASLNALKSLMNSVLITEGDRRRAGIEVVRTIQNEDTTTAEDAEVVDMETERQRLAGERLMSMALEAPFEVPEYEFDPIHLGNTWEKNPVTGQYILPERTLGWQIIKWCSDNLTGPGGGPWQFTPEQARFVLWWYAIDERGRWVYRDGILQRIKGWGKDPFAAVLALVELVGPCRFKGWAKDDYPLLGVSKGDPVAKDNPQAWVQIAAVSGAQTKNTMLCFPWLVDEQFKQKYRLVIGKEIIYAYGGNRRIEAVTSNPRALEGGRPSFMIRNETHHWIESNDGHEMADVIERNLTKSSDGSARALSITNAYSPHESSVAQRQRETWEAEASGASISTGVYYDSLEASPAISLSPPRPEEIKDERFNELYGEMTKKWLATLVAAVRGDSYWLDVERIVLSMLDKNRSISTSKRFWLNVITTTEDAWVDPEAIEASILDAVRKARDFDHDQLRVGWQQVMPDEEVVMFGDGSKSQDSTALVGVRVEDGYTFLIGVWQKPHGKRGDNWLAPRQAVDARVREAFARFNVVGFWFDPSHAKDDEDSSRFWDTYCDEWMRDFGDRLVTWATKAGHRKHAVMFDMTSPERVALFTSAAEMTVEEFERKNDIEEFTPAFSIDGHPALVNHLRNARKYPTTWGESLGKENRSSLKKVDAAVCLVGGQLLRRLHLNATFDDDSPRDGGLWGH